MYKFELPDATRDNQLSELSFEGDILLVYKHIFITIEAEQM